MRQFVAALPARDQWGLANVALVRRSAAELLDEARAGRLHRYLSEQAAFQLESRVGAGEVRSWQRSLPVLLADLAEAGLGEVE